MAPKLSSVKAGPEHITLVPAPDAGEAPRRPRRAPLVFLALLLLAAGALGAAALLGRGHESTDNAQVDGHLVNVSARVGGQVARVGVHDNQLVKEGDVLVELDRSTLETQAQAARADLAAAQAALHAAQAQVTLTRQNAA